MSVSGQKLVPPGLRTLLGLLAELAEFLPLPADGNWDRRRDVERSRASLLTSRLRMLDDQLAVCELYPDVGEQELAAYCQRSAQVIRAELAEPLGYQARTETAACLLD